MPQHRYRAVDADLSDVIIELEARNLLADTSPASMKNHVKRIHYIAYGLLIWPSRLEEVPDSGRPFIDEVGSDAVQLVPHVLAGYRKASSLMLRGIIENCLRHIYYISHPIEFILMNEKEKWYMPTAELFKYAGNHPVVARYLAHYNALDCLRNAYSDLSADVHGRTLSHMESVRLIRDIKYTKSSVDKFVLKYQRVASDVHFMLAALHELQMRKFDHDERRHILRAMAKAGRCALHKVEK